MAHRDDFSMRLEPATRTTMCDVCTQMIGTGEPGVTTYIGIGAQSDVCMDCAQAIADLVEVPRMAPRRSREVVA